MQPLKKSKDATPCCKICFKEIKCDAFHQIFSNQTICSNCIKNLKPEFIEFKIKNCKAIAIYRYDDLIKGMIFQYKGCHDYELKSVFLNYVKNFLKIMYFSYIIVPMPSYFKDDEIRGYNHVEEIFKELNLKMEKVLVKNKKHKQSDLNYTERHKVKEVLEAKNAEKIRNKKILLVDDICTTGSSLRAAIDILKEYNPKTIEVLVIAKREFSEEERAKLSEKIEIL